MQAIIVRFLERNLKRNPPKAGRRSLPTGRQATTLAASRVRGQTVLFTRPWRALARGYHPPEAGKSASHLKK